MFNLFPGFTAEWLNNTAGEYVTAIFVFIAIVVVLKIIQRLLVSWLSRLVNRTDTDVDNALVKIFTRSRPPMYWFIAFAAAVQMLEFEGGLAKAVQVILIAWLTYHVVLALQIIIHYLLQQKLINSEDRSSQIVSSIISFTSIFVLWALGILFVLSNVGVDVTSLIAGLGIGGIAVALAVQNVLGDLLSSLAIYFDRPFEPGDFIVVGDVTGTVDKVGIKTTRINALSGEQIVVPNKDLTSSRIHNYKRMNRRRVVFTLDLVYGTAQEKMKQVPAIVEGIIKSQEDATFDRAHFKEFSDSSLRFEVVYYVESKVYSLYMDIHQQILLGIKEAFEKEKVEFAFPTRTVHVQQI